MVQAELLEALPVAVYTTDAEGTITFYNQAAADLWGHRPRVGHDKWCGSFRLYWPDGRPLPHDECPMAVTLKEGRPVRGVDAVAERPDGTRVAFMPYPTPLRDASGRLVGAINVLVDITQPRQADIQMARLAAIVASSDDAIVSKNLDGRITSWNAGAARIFGYDEAEMVGQSILKLVPPDLHDEEKNILATLARGEHIEHYETVRIAKDGRRIDISLTVSPLSDRAGRVIGATKVARDVTERKHAEKMQRMLVDELNHRVKNTLATVQAIASQSMRRTGSPADFVSSFNGRVQALARAHALFAQHAMAGAELREIVQDQVLFGTPEDDRIACAGPSVMLNQDLALHLALVLYELGTNARKYGALSNRTGRISIGWEVRNGRERKILLCWKETGSPTISAPTKSGFGTTLIENTLRAHNGDASVQYASDGLSWEISLPLPEEAQANIKPHSMALQPNAKTSMLKQQIPSTLAGKRILVVEDEPLLSMEIEMILAEAGAEVIGPAGTLEQARRLLADATCDAALLDANLGNQRSDELAASLTRQNIPFAFVTGYGREGLPQGFRDAIVLGKPFDGHELVATAELLLYQGDTVVKLRGKVS